MTCQVCGTKDNKDARGPVNTKHWFGEGLCAVCLNWALFVPFRFRGIIKTSLQVIVPKRIELV
jgi:hypothetical protein